MGGIKILDIVIPVYNESDRLPEALNAISTQYLPSGWGKHVYIVDDGSDVAISLEEDTQRNFDLHLIRLNSNQGCSVARNKGASKGVGEAILFIDADCALASNDVISLLLEQYEKGFDICFGQIQMIGDGFWARYQNGVALERANSFRNGNKSCMTTSIFLVKRSEFEAVGGFDEAYHFGFEDRDLFIALKNSGLSIFLEERALVNHNDDLSLKSVASKLYKSGKISSVYFAEKHPGEYSNMPYIRVDVRYSKIFLKVVVFFTKPILRPTIFLIDWCINRNLLPYFAAKNLVKYSAGLAYLHGTHDAL